MTKFGSEIINVALGFAKGWKEMNCKEVNNVPNDVQCFKYLFSNNYEKVIGNAWCTATQCTFIKVATNNIGITNPYKFTLSSWNFYEQSVKLGLEINDTPEAGCVFFYETSTGGHVGTVVGVTKRGVITVEGNSQNALICYGCPKNGIAVIGEGSKERTHERMAALGAKYIHIQKYGGNMPVTPGANKVEKPVMAGTGSVVGGLLLASAIIGGIYYAKNS